MSISSFYFRNRKKLLFYLIGLVLISALLYFTILRYSGYIYYWDLSGAFDFRDPFGQYVKLFTSWDASNVGLRNRLPIIGLIYLLYLPFKAFGASSEVVIKIAVALLFIGAYTAIFFLAPKLIKLFCKQNVEKQGGIYVWALIIALVYSFIPFYTYRISQLHLFYMSVFYPIHVYLFLKLLESEKFELKTVILFVISMFFGLTTPNIIVFDLFTFVIFFAFKVVFSLKNIKQLWYPMLNIAIAGVLTIIVNLYWIVPYFISGSPEPGYVINTTTSQMLAQGVTLQNFLLGQSDWFVSQSNLVVLDTSSMLYVIQILGCIVFYAVAIYGLVRHVREKYLIPIIILLLIAPLLILDIFPYHDIVFNFLLYSPFGWVFREINRLSFFWFFWMFILFALGSYSLFESILLEGKLNHILKIVILPAIFIPFVIYIFPVNATFFKYLKPMELDSSIKEVYQLLEDDSDYFSVYYYPQQDAYSIAWMDDKFDIANSEEYKLIAYNSPKPSVDISSVIPNGKNEQGMLTDYLFEEKDSLPELASSLASAGVKYVILRKDAVPINLSEDYVRSEIIYPMYTYLENSSDFTNVLENDYYIVYKNAKYVSIVANKSNALYTYESFNILEHLDSGILNNYDVRFCGFEENSSDCEAAQETNVFLKYYTDTDYFMNFLSKDDLSKYGYYLYDYVYDHKIGVDWGRASYSDKVNGELHNVFRNYDIHAWNFNLIDKAVYSDEPFIKMENDNVNDYKSTATFSQESTCSGNCTAFAYILFNHLGGKLTFTIDNQSFIVDTKSDFEQYKWVELGVVNLSYHEDVSFEIENSSGFSSLGGIVILPSSVLTNLEQKVDQINFLDVSEDSVLDSSKLSIYRDDCKISTYDYETGLIPKLSLSTTCLSSTDLYLRNYKSEVLFSSDSTSILNSSLIKNVSVYNQESQIWFIGQDNLFSILLFLFSLLITVLLLILY